MYHIGWLINVQCFDTLINLAPYVKPSHLATLIDSYVILIERRVQITLNVSMYMLYLYYDLLVISQPEFIRCVSLTWPRFTPGAIFASQLSLRLDDYIYLDPPISTPYLIIYASLSALYGFDRTMVSSCVQ